jgi:PAS domain S-box-containing protein
MSGNASTPLPSFLSEFNAPDLLNLLADGAYITDTERRIVFWNQAAARITGWEAAQVVGRQCRDNLLIHVDKDGHALCGDEHCPLHRSIVTGQPSAAPLLVFAQHRSGSRVPVEVTVAPIRNAAGKMVGGIEVFRDLTESVRDQLRAKEIQDQAVKCELPQDHRVSFEARYQPRDIVGGDFFRIEALDAAHYALLVADVRGHGVSAALYTMCLRAFWNEHRPTLPSPARFMALVSDGLQALGHGMGYFGTAVLAVYNAANGEIRLVRAGHPAPVLMRADGHCEIIGVANPALGLFRNTTFHETVERLTPGDALLLFTDGATELFDRQDHELGREGLLQLIRTQTRDHGLTTFKVDELERQLLEFTNQIRLPDDLTLVKLRREG